MNQLEEFKALGLSDDILTAIAKKGFETPSAIQSLTIPHLLTTDKDIIAQAQTGTGKTAAFGLPIIQMLTSRRNIPQAIVLVPTRELALQVTEEILSYISGEEVLSSYKVKRSWLYTTAKRNLIPICKIAGKNYYSKSHVEECLGLNADIAAITDWLTTEQVFEVFGMKPTAIHAYAYRHRIPTKKEYGILYYSKTHLDELRRIDLIEDANYCTVEDVSEKYGLSKANVHHIAKVHGIKKRKVGVRNFLLRCDVERAMTERAAKGL